ncbi:serine hydrolase [Pseudoxanthomonas sp. NC8]|nr:serine hydrolase [Pseudoxanthomonas sp. NC8]
MPVRHFATDLAGVGGVRATLDDMVRYVQGGLGGIDAPIRAALATTHAQVSAQPAMGMNWMRVPVNGRTVLMHEGGTGGFSAFVSLDPQRQRGVVVLSDTTWTSIGSLGSLGLHLVDESLPLGRPRKAVAADPALLHALAGEYQLQGAMKMTLRARDGRLFVRPRARTNTRWAMTMPATSTRWHWMRCCTRSARPTAAMASPGRRWEL